MKAISRIMLCSLVAFLGSSQTVLVAQVSDQPVSAIDRVQELEEALRECQTLALAGQFAAATMHEINGPLAAIANLNYLLQTNPDDGEQVRNYSGLLCNAVEALPVNPAVFR